MWASSGNSDHLGLHSGTVRPNLSQSSLTSVAKAWRTSSLSRSLSLSCLYIWFFGDPGRPKMFIVRMYHLAKVALAFWRGGGTSARFVSQYTPERRSNIYSMSHTHTAL